MEIKPIGDVVIVTGAGQGIGRAIAQAFGREGVKVAANDYNGDAAEATAELIRKDGGTAMGIAADVSKEAEVQKMVKQVEQKFGPVDMLMNNAGISPKRNGMGVPVWEMDFSEWDRVVQVNLTGQWMCARAVMNGMIQRRKGVIVNTASVAATKHSLMAGCHYHATKAGVTGLTRALAGELGRFGIRVCAVAPGRIRTEMAAKTPKELNDRILSKIPLGVWGEPYDIANLVIFLTSPAAGHITSDTILVDGGWGMGLAY